MTDPAHRRVFVARRNVDDLLAEDCERFFPWPALHASLMADVKRLREQLR